MEFEKEELFDAVAVLLRVIDIADESDKSTLTWIAGNYLEKLGEVIGVTAASRQ